MKKLFFLLLVSFLAFTNHAQQSENRFDAAFRAPDKAFDKANEETEYDTITTRFRVSKIYEDKAIVFSSRFHYEVPVEARINPFDTKLEEGKEYVLSIFYNKAIREEKHCSGCSGTVPAELIWMTITPEQIKRDARFLKELVEDSPGYDSSPRY